MIICGRHALCVYEYTHLYVQKQKDPYGHIQYAQNTACKLRQ